MNMVNILLELLQYEVAGIESDAKTRKVHLTYVTAADFKRTYHETIGMFSLVNRAIYAAESDYFIDPGQTAEVKKNLSGLRARLSQAATDSGIRGL